MSHLIEVRSADAASTTPPRGQATARRFALASVFVVILLGAAAVTDQWSTATVSAVLGFATAVTVIAAVFVGWERQIDAAESAGLVKHYDQHVE
ncbi:hypothetical protein BCA37_25175 [Mycobacterium sp. djl-10]|nr:hypothetical protein BCA37_25175 [Mycobacterium sp. djl-10]